MSIKVGKIIQSTDCRRRGIGNGGVHGRMRSVGRHPERSEVL